MVAGRKDLEGSLAILIVNNDNEFTQGHRLAQNPACVFSSESLNYLFTCWYFTISFSKKKEYDFSRLTIFLKILNIVYVELLNFAIALQHH